MLRALLIICLLGSSEAFSQGGSETELKVERKAKNWDTTMYRKYETVLIVGVFQQHRTFSNEFSQHMSKDSMGLSANTFSTESDFSGQIGLVANYDKFQLSVAKGLAPPDNAGGKGHTDVFNVGLNVGDNRWISENYYRRFKGFYNTNNRALDSMARKTNKYYVLPGMVSSLFMTRFMFFRNYENFSFKSGFGCNYRQLKSAFTFVSGGSFSVFNLRNDSAIIPTKARSLYNDYANMRGMQSVNVSYNVGFAGTLVVFKAWFIGGYFTVGPEQQWRNYDLTSYHRRLSYISLSGTGRLSMGLNLKRFYMVWSFANDYNVYNSPKTIKLQSNSFTLNTTFGWRFHYDTPKFYQKFMKTKVYQYL